MVENQDLLKYPRYAVSGYMGNKRYHLVEVLQSNAKGDLIGGFDVRVNIVDKLVKKERVRFVLPRHHPTVR